VATTLPPVPIGEPAGSLAWQQWYLALQQLYTGAGTIAWDLVDKTGSDLVDLAARDHASLQNIQGGSSGERYHFTLAQHTFLAALVAGELVAGTWTPTLTNVSNLDSSTAFQCQYSRIGGTVTGSGKVTLDPTAAAATEIGISLPVASNFGADEDAAGVAYSQTNAQGGAISADTANDRMALKFLAIGTASVTLYFTFSYQVI
jgi:hypothetical protein